MSVANKNKTISFSRYLQSIWNKLNVILSIPKSLTFVHRFVVTHYDTVIRKAISKRYYQKALSCVEQIKHLVSLSKVVTANSSHTNNTLLLKVLYINKHNSHYGFCVGRDTGSTVRWTTINKRTGICCSSVVCISSFSPAHPFKYIAICSTQAIW